MVRQVERLQPGHAKAERLDALGWMDQHLGSAELDRAIPALERVIKDDPETDVRRRAITTLARLELQRKRPCPLALFEAVLSPTDNVRWEAGLWVGQFQEFAPGAAAVLLRGTRSDKPDVRGNVLFPLGRAARKDAKLVPAIRERLKDEAWFVRDCAQIALYRATDQFDDYLPYLARERETAHRARPAGEGESAAEKRLRETRNLLLIGRAGLLSEWLETRPKDVARVLGKMLDDKAPAERVAPAILLADFAPLYPLLRRSDRKAGIEGTTPWAELTADNSPQVKRERAAHLASRLKELGLLDRFARLAQNDPDAEVRRAAGEALERLRGQPAGP
jgi:HEAT repeat protein